MMEAWTLFLILWLSDGGVSVVESMEFKRETSCKQAALYVESKPREGIRKITAVCKRHTNV